jgi:high-affinity iron transporter
MSHLSWSISATLLLGTLCVAAEPAEHGTIRGKVAVAASTTSPALVYIERVERADDFPPMNVTVDQKNFVFHPRVSAVTVGGVVEFLNNDREPHNVNGQGLFNRLVAPGKKEYVAVDRPGLVRITCNIHHTMLAYVHVLQNPHFATTDAAGNYEIRDVPEGSYRLIAWHELGEPATVADVRVRRGRAAEGVNFTVVPRAPAANCVLCEPPGRGGVGAPKNWTEVVDRIEAALRAGLAAAESGRSEPARKAVEDAYFKHFEGSNLETALGRYRGQQARFRRERGFWALDSALDRLAAAKSPAEKSAAAAEAGGKLTELIAALRADVVDLPGMVDAADADAGAVTDAEQARRARRDLLIDFDAALALYRAGKKAEAAARLQESYQKRFEPVEIAMAARLGPTVKNELEFRFGRVIGLADAGVPLGRLEAEIGRLRTEMSAGLDRLAARLSDGDAESADSGWWVTAFNAFFILLREGFEAILVLGAIMAYLTRTGHGDKRRVIYMAVAAALAVGAATAVVLFVLVNATAHGETMEGLSMLLASAVLFYVSYWLISKAEARHWFRYIHNQVEDSLSRGSLWALGTTAFLAVYREAAETALFLHSLAKDGGSAYAAVGAGVVGGAAALAGLWAAMSWGGMRLPLKPLFTVSSALLYALAVVFAGKGVAELQAAGVMNRTPVDFVPDWAFLREWFGVYPTTESLGLQAILLTAALLAGFVWLWNRSARRAAMEAAAADVGDRQSAVGGSQA